MVIYKNDKNVFFKKKVIIEKSFTDLVQQIENYAEESNVRIKVNQTFRVQGRIVKGAIVKPSSRSNHLVGHAIDFGVLLSDGRQCLSKCIYDMKYNEVKKFINLVRSNNKLRWGGDFRIIDPVHIDDGLNISKPSIWDEMFKVLQSFDNIEIWEKEL